jgi:hypothetical protein
MAVKGLIDSPEEYFEKTAGFWDKMVPGMAKGLKEFGIQNKKWLIPTTVGLGVAGGVLGATGISGALGEGNRAGDTMGYRIDRSLNSLFDRVKADEAFGTSFASNLGGDSAKSIMGLAKDMASKGYQTLKDKFDLSPTRKSIFGALKKEDSTLAMADNKTLLEAYHTMANVAPILSTDKNAVRSFLTEAATSGNGGLNFQTIKGIADAELAVARAKNPSMGVKK